MSIYGYLNLGVGLAGVGVTSPSAAAGYLPQPISFDEVLYGATVNQTACVFGPVTSSWGTLTAFDVTDTEGNVMCTGALSAPYTPVVGQIVNIEPGSVVIYLYQPFADNGGVLTENTPVFPSTSTNLNPGDIWSNSGVLNFVPGFTQDITIGPQFYGVVTGQQLLATGVRGMSTTLPISGSGQLYLVGSEIWVA